MKFFIDTADLDEIRAARDLGVLDGVTTNPSLIAKQTRQYRALLEAICDLVPGPVSAEVLATQADTMLAEARQLSQIADNIVVKLPATPEGLKACVRCADEDIKTNLTLIFQPLQALLVAKAGATYCSPFLGRLDDIGHDGMQLIRTIRQIYDNYDFDTELLAASLRHPLHVVQAALAGADIVTMPLAVIDKLLKHPLTDIGLERFLADGRAAGLTAD